MRAGANAETEWTWEPPPESLITSDRRRGRRGTVIEAQGIELMNQRCACKEAIRVVSNADGELGWHHGHNPSLTKGGFFYCLKLCGMEVWRNESFQRMHLAQIQFMNLKTIKFRFFRPNCVFKGIFGICRAAK